MLKEGGFRVIYVSFVVCDVNRRRGNRPCGNLKDDSTLVFRYYIWRGRRGCRECPNIGTILVGFHNPALISVNSKFIVSSYEPL